VRDKYACNEASERGTSALGTQRISLSGFELMLKEFFRINIRTCQKLKSETSHYITPVQRYLKVPASFWIRLSCFSVQRYLCKTPAEICCSNSKIHPPDTNYARLLIHISFKRNSTNGEFLFLKNCFVSHLTSTRRERTRPLERHLTCVW